ncbi:hypothetical protein TCAL_05317 [Tigriopus californicus]|uniref:poly(A)-specific ribonuclease n=1 Tax=Tigriopus californicus TaxID=6832 RepID=A0A553PHS7_TIGCA|nr:CCR4-NOT transcription complex subunit 7-like [Tigriopus californicus]TRY77241.1 hypothetical protein TCAL_05317 [Tigriopus californicus]
MPDLSQFGMGGGGHGGGVGGGGQVWSTNGMTFAGGGVGVGGTSNNEDCGIREVWNHNLEEEFKSLCNVVQKYHYVAMDTEFPGVVARPIGEFKSTADYQYQLLRCNVDLLKIIQLGLTFQDEKGHLPVQGPSTWQFNFKFNLTEDMYAEDSVELLQTSGIQFEKHDQEGIDPTLFAEMMLTSGLVLMEPVKWLSFHSGYDFGYLLKLLTNQPLPKTEGEFFEILKLYFPNVYDVKYLMKSTKNLKGGLQEVANELEVQRIGPQHQAGSDSLLTGQTFFRMKEMFFEDDIDDSKYSGHLYGLGTNFVVTSSANNSCTNLAAIAAAAVPPAAANPAVIVPPTTVAPATPTGIAAPSSTSASAGVTSSNNSKPTSPSPTAGGVSGQSSKENSAATDSDSDSGSGTTAATVEE